MIPMKECETKKIHERYRNLMAVPFLSSRLSIQDSIVAYRHPPEQKHQYLKKESPFAFHGTKQGAGNQLPLK